MIKKILFISVLSLIEILGFISIAKAQDKPLTITLNRIKGGVMIDSQGQYKPVISDTMVTSNTKILLQKSATAQLVYPSGCTLTLQENKIYKPGDESHCKQGAPILVSVNDTVVGALPAAAKAESENRTTAWLFGAGALGLVGAAVAAGGSSSQQAPSPSP